MKKFFFRKKKGFTLIELLIVVAIIGIIAGIAIPRFLGVRTKAKVTRAFADMANIGTALEMYYVDHDEYPVLDEGVTDLGTAIGGDPDLGDYISSIPDD
ncbi:prepilin-type N-terminal cleavage/methylation domain-containing protein, partial [Candidatus Aerophobetes bacterium]|nr:prepilin-type N-terminal cleavage/methylation domain-containing protein [Candidatus Aerophobetes bacterium]